MVLHSSLPSALQIINIHIPPPTPTSIIFALKMTSIITLASTISPCSITDPSNLRNPPPKSNLFNLKPQKIQSLSLKKSNCQKIPSFETTPFDELNLYPDSRLEISPISSSGHVSIRLRRLVSEFQSLPEPIDRVKRLLDYATLLPQFGESTRSEENRVPGCAAQVWLEVEMDELGRMRYRADSDSEITKGFCSCLIFLLDGAFPHDVLEVEAEDLADMNVGLPVRSRVNSWHNVLVCMQERTKKLAAEREEMCHLNPLEACPLVISADSITSKGLYPEALTGPHHPTPRVLCERGRSNYMRGQHPGGKGTASIEARTWDLRAFWQTLIPSHSSATPRPRGGRCLSLANLDGNVFILKDTVGSNNVLLPPGVETFCSVLVYVLISCEL